MSKEIRFRCPHCEVILRAKTANSGREMTCPRCREELRVPTVAAERQPTETASRREAIPVVCTVCQTRMYAYDDQIGGLIECPDCFTQNVVRDVPAKKRTHFVEGADDFSYNLAPAHHMDVQKAAADDLMSEAERAVEKEIAEQPRVPEKPFVSGVLMFPFQGRVFPVVLGMVLSWALVMTLIKMAWSLQGHAALVAPFLLAGSGFAILLVICPTLVCLQKMLEFTAQGDDDSEYRPEGGILNFVDWIMDIIPLILAAVIGFTPGMMLVRAIGLPMDVFPIVAFAASLLFPVVLLSIMESASLSGVYSRPIWSSVGQHPGVWLKFYAVGSLLLLIGGGAVAALVNLVVRDLTPLVGLGALVALFVAMLTFTIYFRLLGRLAFVLIQTIEVEDSTDETDDDPVADTSEISLGV